MKQYGDEEQDDEGGDQVPAGRGRDPKNTELLRMA